MGARFYCLGISMRVAQPNASVILMSAEGIEKGQA